MDRIAWLVIGLGALGAGPAGAAGPSGEAACPRLLAADGQPSDLDACALSVLLDEAALRRHLSACVRRALEVSFPPPARLDFALELYPGGAARGIDLRGDPDQAGLLGRCARRVLGQRFQGTAVGRPAALEGSLRLASGQPERFSLALGAAVSSPPPPAADLEGAFEQTPAGLVASCALPGFRLVLRLGGGPAEPPPSVEPEDDRDPRVAACLQAAETPVRTRGRAAPRPVACLEALLGDADLATRAAAASALAGERRWGSRRKIERSLLGALRGPNGPAGEPPALVAPADERAGLALVGMLEALLDLYRQPSPEVPAALAAHPSSRVRRRLVERVLRRWRGDASLAVARLLTSPEADIRVRAEQLGCLRGDWQSLAAFRRDLVHPEAEVRARAVLLARACAQRSASWLVEAAAREPEVALAMLMLRAAPVGLEAELAPRLAGGLLHPCPAARFLAAGLLGRLERPPAALLGEALRRERDPWLRAWLEGLRAGQEHAPGEIIQLWLQPGPGPGAASTEAILEGG
jgi:hypothetical protein